MLKTISVKTSAQTEMVDVTSQVQSELSKSGIEEGRLGGSCGQVGHPHGAQSNGALESQL
jgi:thiamine phosphate synthase YjbQ (UPF0047 family)